MQALISDALVMSSVSEQPSRAWASPAVADGGVIISASSPYAR